MQERGNCVGGELCAVEGRGGQSPEGLGQRFSGDGARFGKRAATNLLCQERSTSDRGRATAAQEARFGDAYVHDPSGELQDVAADGITHFDCAGGIAELANIARIAEVLENGFAEHF